MATYEKWINLLTGTPWVSTLNPAGTEAEPYKYIYDIEKMDDTVNIKADDNVIINIEHDQTFRETPYIPLAMDSGKTFRIQTVRDATTDGQAVISGADEAGGFKLPALLGSTEFLEDGGVEKWISASELEEWDTLLAYGTVAREDTNVQAGNYSVKLERTSTYAYGIYQHGAVLEFNKNYRITVLHYNEDVTTSPTIYIVRGENPFVGNYLQDDNTWSGVISATGLSLVSASNVSSGKWTKSSIDFNTGSDLGSESTKYTICISSYTAGKYVLVDSVSFRKLIETDGLITNPGAAGEFDSYIVDNHDFETWPGTYPDDWTGAALGGSGSTIAKEIGTVYSGLNAIKITPSSDETRFIRQGLNLNTGTTYKISIAHMEQLNTKGQYDATAMPGIAIINGAYTGSGDEYWTPSGWVVFSYWWSLPQRQYWGVDEIEFTTTATDSTYTILLFAANSPLGTPVYSQYYDYYFDYVQVGRADVDTPDLSSDPQMLAWDTDGKLVHYTHIDKSNDNVPWNPTNNNSLVYEGELPRFNGIGKGATISHWGGEDVGIYQKYDLENNISYRAQVFANIHKTYSVPQNQKFYMAVVKNIDEINYKYWDPSIEGWTDTYTNAASVIGSNWNILSVDFTADAASDYSVVVHSGVLTDSRIYDAYEIFIDELSLVKTVVNACEPYDDDIYHTYFDWPHRYSDWDTWTPVEAGSPFQVYVTGNLRQLDVEGYQLHKERMFTNKPRLMCWSYDEPNRILYINVGEDPKDLTIEAVVRDRVIDTGTNSGDGNNLVVISDLTCQKSAYDCIRIREDVSARKSDITIEKCIIEDAGTSSIASGYRDATDHSASQRLKYTCKDVLIDRCKCYRGNSASITNRESYGGDYITDNIAQYWTENDIDIAVGLDHQNEAGDEAGTQTIKNCLVQGQRPLINANYYNNGIFVYTGELIYIYDNEITKVNHGIVVIGYLLNPSAGNIPHADSRYVEVKGNHVYKTGDDSCWLALIDDTTNGNSKVCFNVFAWSQDNNLELQSCIGTEVYNNLFHKAFNQQLGLYDNSYVFVFNNIFDYWNEFLKNTEGYGGHTGGAGCAIGFSGSLEEPPNSGEYPFTYYNFMDNNMFFSDPEKTDAKAHIFNLESYTYTKELWIEKYNYERRSAFWNDPRFVNRDELNFILQHDSPAIDRGLVIKNIREQIGSTVFKQFDNVNSFNSLIDPDTSWPYAVRFVDGDLVGPENTMDIGPFAFITNKTLYTMTNATGGALAGLIGVIDSYKSNAGADLTPIPEIYEVGNGVYAFASRVTQAVSVVVDGDSEDAETLADSERYKFNEVSPDAGYLKILTETTQSTGEIYQNTIEILDSVTNIDENSKEALGLAFKNSIRFDRKWEMIDGELRLVFERLWTYTDATHNTVLHKYILEYQHSGGERVVEMKQTRET